MPISIKDAETDSRIGDLAELAGESIAVAVRIAIEQRLRRGSSRRRAGVADRLLSLTLARTGTRQGAGSAEDAIGYDGFGPPK